MKEYKNSSELIDILISKGIIINDHEKDEIIKILQTENYYNIINGYKNLFLNKDSLSYKKGTTFFEIYSLYKFDREIRNIYLKYLLKIENKLKSVISNVFSEKYGHDNYLKLTNFNTSFSEDIPLLKRIAKKNNLSMESDLEQVKKISARDNIASITKLIGDIQQEIARQMSKNHDAVTHYMTKHGYIPLWVLVNILTFGKITNFYLNLKKADKIAIAKQFHIDYKHLHQYMIMLGFSRNRCAHDEKFFDIRFKNGGIHTKSILNFNKLELNRGKDKSYLHGINDAYSIAILFALFLDKEDITDFINSISFQIDKLDLHTITKDTVLIHMGFNSKWTNLIKLK